MNYTSFPDTPNTIINKLSDKNHIYSQQLLWTQFFGIYHIPIKTMIFSSFREYSWHYVAEEIVEELTTDIVMAVRDSFNKTADNNSGFIVGKSKFRYFLKRIVNNKVVDFIRKNKNLSKNVSLQALENFDLQADDNLSDSEEEAYRYSQILDTYEKVIRPSLDPNYILAFEKRYFENQKPALIANELGLTSRQVSDYIYKVIQKLKEIVNKEQK